MPKKQGPMLNESRKLEEAAETILRIYKDDLIEVARLIRECLERGMTTPVIEVPSGGRCSVLAQHLLEQKGLFIPARGDGKPGMNYLRITEEGRKMCELLAA